MKRAIMAAGPQPRAYSQLGTVFSASRNIFASSHGLTGLQGLGRTPSSPAQPVISARKRPAARMHGRVA